MIMWMSSERQWDGGFTKLSAIQLLADRQRCGFFKLRFDPEFVAAKRKCAAVRAHNRKEFSVSRGAAAGLEKGMTLT